MRSRLRLGAVADLAVIGLVAWVLLRPSGPVGGALARWKAERAVRQRINSDWAQIASGPRLDTTASAVALVEFSDYECPFCRSQHGLLKRVIGDSRGGGVVFRHLPLPIHKNALHAALSAVCAEEQGRFREMHDRLFETEAWMTDANWRREASAAGVPDLVAFSNCLSSTEATARIRTDAALARDLGISGTPSFVHREGVVAGSLADSTIRGLRQRSGP